MDAVDGRYESKNLVGVSQLSTCVLSIIILTDSMLSKEAVKLCMCATVSSLAPKRSDIFSVDADEGGGCTTFVVSISEFVTSTVISDVNASVVMVFTVVICSGSVTTDLESSPNEDISIVLIVRSASWIDLVASAYDSSKDVGSMCLSVIVSKEMEFEANIIVDSMGSGGIIDAGDDGIS